MAARVRAKAGISQAAIFGPHHHQSELIRLGATSERPRCATKASRSFYGARYLGRDGAARGRGTLETDRGRRQAVGVYPVRHWKHRRRKAKRTFVYSD